MRFKKTPALFYVYLIASLVVAAVIYFELRLDGAAVISAAISCTAVGLCIGSSVGLIVGYREFGGEPIPSHRINPETRMVVLNNYRSLLIPKNEVLFVKIVRPDDERESNHSPVTLIDVTGKPKLSSGDIPQWGDIVRVDKEGNIHIEQKKEDAEVG